MLLPPRLISRATSRRRSNLIYRYRLCTDVGSSLLLWFYYYDPLRS